MKDQMVAVYAGLILVIVLGLTDAKVKCYECKDTEKGWCDTMDECEDNFCYKVNSTVNGQRHLRLGCVATGEIGCIPEGSETPMAQISGIYCTCATDFCNYVSKPTSSSASSAIIFSSLLWPGLVSLGFLLSGDDIGHIYAFFNNHL